MMGWTEADVLVTRMSTIRAIQRLALIQKRESESQNNSLPSGLGRAGHVMRRR